MSRLPSRAPHATADARRAPRRGVSRLLAAGVAAGLALAGLVGTAGAAIVPLSARPEPAPASQPASAPVPSREAPGAGLAMIRPSQPVDATPARPQVGTSGPDSVSVMVTTPERWVWMGTFGGGLYLERGGEPRLHFAPDPTNPAALPSGFIHALHYDANGALWIAHSVGLTRYADGQFRQVPMGTHAGLPVLSVSSGQDGEILAFTGDRMVAIDPGGFIATPQWMRPTALATYAGLLFALGVAGGIVSRARLRRRRVLRDAEADRAAAVRASEAKSRFLADLGHEIRTPLTGILGMGELLASSGLSPAQRRQALAIQRAGRHLLDLINDALDLARVEQGKLDLERSPFDARAVVREVAALLAPLAERKGLRFRFELDDDAPRGLLGDARRVRQVLLNLGNNALKFTERGEVGLSMHAREGGGVLLKVSDTGPGMGPAQQARLFQRFEQGEMPRPGVRQVGSGLGLAICRELVEAMGGRIRIDSAPGRGTTFEVLLPLPPVAIAAPADDGPRRPLPPKRVLLVEDDPTVAETVAGLLARDGHVVRVAAHGLEALAALDEHDFDLALLDLDLPVVDGFELARLIRAAGHALPLAALTARVDPRDEPAAFAAGMDGFLRKPVTGDLLADALRDLSEGARGVRRAPPTLVALDGGLSAGPRAG